MSVSDKIVTWVRHQERADKGLREVLGILPHQEAPVTT